MRESVIQKGIIDYLNTLSFNFKTIKCNKNGIPDIIICHKGRFIALEVKNATGKASKLQQVRLEAIRDNGGIGEIVRSVDDVKKILEGY